MNTILMALTVGLAAFAVVYWRRIGAVAAQVRLLAHKMHKEFH